MFVLFVIFKTVGVFVPKRRAIVSLRFTTNRYLETERSFYKYVKTIYRVTLSLGLSQGLSEKEVEKHHRFTHALYWEKRESYNYAHVSIKHVF